MKPFTDERRQKISAALTGKKHSPETIEKYRATRRGRSLSAEHRAKIGAAGKGKPKSESHRAALSAAAKRRPPRPKQDRGLLSRRHHLKKTYGMSVEQYDRMVVEQGGLCAICRSPNAGSTAWHVDHCHETDLIRGLLCARCNHMLGHARDSVLILRAAIAYLERFAC